MSNYSANRKTKKLALVRKSRLLLFARLRKRIKVQKNEHSVVHAAHSAFGKSKSRTKINHEQIEKRNGKIQCASRALQPLQFRVKNSAHMLRRKLFPSFAPHCRAVCSQLGFLSYFCARDVYYITRLYLGRNEGTTCTE